MRKKLQKAVVQAIAALVLIALIRVVAMITMKGVDAAYSVIDIALSVAVVIVLLRFMNEFNQQLAIESPEYPQFQSVVKWFILLLVVLTFYGAFRLFSTYLPYSLYHIIFFILAMIPVYFLWNIIYKNADMLSELLISTAEGKRR